MHPDFEGEPVSECRRQAEHEYCVPEHPAEYPGDESAAQAHVGEPVPLLDQFQGNEDQAKR